MKTTVPSIKGLSAYPAQEKESDDQHDERYPKLNISQYSRPAIELLLHAGNYRMAAFVKFGSQYQYKVEAAWIAKSVCKGFY